jgi:ubiquitin C-terminal hydrolase
MDFPSHLDISPYTSMAHDAPSASQHSYSRGVDSVSPSSAASIAKMKLKEKPSTISSFLYQLVSVIVHHGNHAGGHYTVYRRLFPPSIAEDYKKAVSDGMKMKEGDVKEWVHISDEKCESVDLDEVMNSQAYMLFYERVS